MILLLSVMAMLQAPPVVVSALTTPQLAEYCRGKDAGIAPDLCTGYILGAFDTLSLAHEICPSPKRASTLKVTSTVRKYLRTHPKKWTSAPSFVVRDALREAFACQRKSHDSRRS